MRLAALAAVPFVLGTSVPALAVSETAEGFAAAMQGCWNRASWSAAIEEAQRTDPEFTAASQMCLSGGVEGVLTFLDCSGVNNLVECAPAEGRYEFRDEKFWRDFGDAVREGQRDNCDVTLEAGKQFTLLNCQWVEAPASAGSIEDVVYERAIGQ